MPEQDAATAWEFYVGPALTDSEVSPVILFVQPSAALRLHSRDKIMWAGLLCGLEEILDEQYG